MFPESSLPPVTHKLDWEKNNRTNWFKNGEFCVTVVRLFYIDLRHEIVWRSLILFRRTQSVVFPIHIMCFLWSLTESYSQNDFSSGGNKPLKTER